MPRALGDAIQEFLHPQRSFSGFLFHILVLRQSLLHVAQAGLKLEVAAILLSQPLEGWGYRCAQGWLVVIGHLNCFVSNGPSGPPLLVCLLIAC